MSLSLIPREIQSGLMIEVSGRYTIFDETLRQAVLEFLKSGKRHFVLNMSSVSYVDSYGLGELVRLYNSVKKADGRLQLLAPSERVRTLLRMTKLDTVFEILDDDSGL